MKKKQPNDFNAEEFMNSWRNNGIAEYHAENEWLAKKGKEYKARIYNFKQSIDDLNILQDDLIKQITALKSKLFKVLDEIPDKATDLNSFALVKDGTFIVNEGLKDKIDERYKNLIDFLENGLKIVQEEIKKKQKLNDTIYKLEQKTQEPKEPILPVPVIALIHRYLCETGEGEGITNENKDSIASDNGYKKKYSGTGLMQDYNNVAKKENRITTNENKKTATTKISRIEAAISELEKRNAPKALKKALDELLLLKNKSKQLLD